MAVDNQTVLVGNLAEDPELRHTAQGIPVASLRLAVNERIRTDRGWEDGETSFFPVVVWRGLAEHVAESLHKGDRAIVAGRWRTRQYETTEGEQRTATELIADEVGPSLKWVVCPQLVRARDRAAAADRVPLDDRPDGRTPGRADEPQAVHRRGMTP